MAKRKAVQYFAPDARMLDIKRRATMPGGFVETEIPRVTEDVTGDLEGRFETIVQQKRQRMAEILADEDDAAAPAKAKELRWLAKDVYAMAPVFGYHAAGEMACALADTLDRLGFGDEQARRFCKWQVDALSIVVRRRIRGTVPQDVVDTIKSARQALDKLARTRRDRD